jgi:hypothetical protein
MTPPRPDSSTAALGACLAAPLAAMLAMASLAAFQADPVAAAETAYLALAAGLVVLAAAAVAARPSVEGLVGPVLLMTAVWTLPEGPSRGAVAMALAAGTLAVAVWRWLPAWNGPEAAGGAADPEYSASEIRSHSGADPSALAALRSLRHSPRYASVARLARTAPRRPRCVTVFPARST